MLALFETLSPEYQTAFVIYAVLLLYSLHILDTYMATSDVSRFPKSHVTMAKWALWPAFWISLFAVFVSPLAVIGFWIAAWLAYGLVMGAVLLWNGTCKKIFG